MDLVRLGEVLAGGLLLFYLAALARVIPWVVLTPLAAIIVFTPVTGPTALFKVGSYKILPITLVSAGAALSAFGGSSYVKAHLERSRLSAAVFVGMLVTSLGLGYHSYKTGAYLDALTYLALVSLAAYAMSLPAQILQPAIARWLRLTGIALAVMCFYHVATRGLGQASTGQVLPDGTFVTSRPLVAEQAFVLGVAAVQAFVGWRSNRVWQRSVAPILLVALVLTQQRDAWISTAIALAVGWAAQRGVERLKTVYWATAVVAIGLIVAGSELLHSLHKSITSLSLSSGTGGDRVQSSSALISQAIHRGPLTILAGSRFGSGYTRTLGVIETYQPHNAYTQTFLRIGVIGLIPLLIMLFRRLRGRSLGSLGSLQRPFLIAFLVFSLAYRFPYETSPLLGLAMIPATVVERTRRAQSKPMATFAWWRSKSDSLN